MGWAVRGPLLRATAGYLSPCPSFCGTVELSSAEDSYVPFLGRGCGALRWQHQTVGVTALTKSITKENIKTH